MQIDKLQEASQTLTIISYAMMNLAENQEEASAVAATLAQASFYLTDMAVHLHRGMEPRNALLATVRGDLRLNK